MDWGAFSKGVGTGVVAGLKEGCLERFFAACFDIVAGAVRSVSRVRRGIEGGRGRSRWWAEEESRGWLFPTDAVSLRNRAGGAERLTCVYVPITEGFWSRVTTLRLDSRRGSSRVEVLLKVRCEERPRFRLPFA